MRNLRSLKLLQAIPVVALLTGCSSAATYVHAPNDTTLGRRRRLSQRCRVLRADGRRQRRPPGPPGAGRQGGRLPQVAHGGRRTDRRARPHHVPDEAAVIEHGAHRHAHRARQGLYAQAEALVRDRVTFVEAELPRRHRSEREGQPRGVGHRRQHERGGLEGRSPRRRLELGALVPIRPAVGPSRRARDAPAERPLRVRAPQQAARRTATRPSRRSSSPSSTTGRSPRQTTKRRRMPSPAPPHPPLIVPCRRPSPGAVVAATETEELVQVATRVGEAKAS